METHRPRLPSEAIEHILVHRQVLDRHPDRIAGILKEFNGIEPTVTNHLDGDTIARYLRDAFPRAEVLQERKTASAVTVGKRFLVIGAADPQSAVEQFTDSKGMVCHGFFHIMVMNNGCVYNCQYCFLQQHIWDKDVSSHIRLNVNYEDIVHRMREIAGQRLREGKGTRFHTGILLDYLGFEAVTGFIEFLVPHLGEDVFAKSTVEMWSKGNDVRVLLEAAAKYPWATWRLRPGWSINSVHAADKYEPGTARTVQRLHAARNLQDAGYRLTIRIDPMVPYTGWKKDYTDLVDMIYRDFGLRPHVVFVASLRFDEPDLIHTGRSRFPNSDLFCHDFPKEDRAKFRLPFEQRLELFRTVIEAIRRHEPDQRLGVCKENLKTWKALDLDPTRSCLAEPLLANTIHQFVLT